NRAHKFIILKHWNAEHCPSTREPSEFRPGVACRHIQIFGPRQNVGNLDRLFCCHGTSKCRSGSRSDYWIALPLLNIRLRCTVHCNRSENIPLASIKETELGLADTGCVGQYRVEDRLKFAWGA